MSLALLAVPLAVVGSLAALVAMRPNTFRVERSTVIKAPPETIAPHIADFRKWTAWSPFEKLDADLKRTYSGAASGVGAVYGWEGRKAGAGRMEITEASTSRVLINLDFTKPMTAHNTAEFTLAPEGEATRVTWAMYGKADIGAKLFGLFCNMDKMVGGSFESGLADLKKVAEA